MNGHRSSSRGVGFATNARGCCRKGVWRSAASRTRVRIVGICTRWATVQTEPTWTRLEARGEFDFGLTASVIARLPAHNGVDCFDETNQTLRRALHTANGARVVTARASKGGLEIDDDSPEARAWAIRAFGLELDYNAPFGLEVEDTMLRTPHFAWGASVVQLPSKPPHVWMPSMTPGVEGRVARWRRI